MAESTPADTSTVSAAPSAIPSAVASTVGTPYSIPPMDPEERTKSLNVSLADMVAKATALYQSKKYGEAAEIFSTATERQAEANGEMAPENADVLFLYGRCLFKVGQSNSDVLGGKAPTEKKKKPSSVDKPKAKKPQAESSTADAPEKEKTGAEEVTDEGVATIAKNAGAEQEKLPDAKKALFQFTGDENFEDSDEEEEADGEGQEEEEEDDDLAVAFEILELSRVLFEKQLEEATTTEGPDKDVAADENKLVRHFKERLSDIHDLLAEISLENEKFPDAIKDCRATLKYKEELYTEDSEIIAEAHFKLSLALEFASMTMSSEDGAEDGPKTVDEAMRTEAAEELEKAIESTKLKLQNKEVELATSHAPEDNDETRKQITDVKEIVADMEQRLTELRKPPVDMNTALGQGNPLAGLLGEAFGESSSEQAARVEEAKKNAKDLSGLVRKKAKEEPKAEPEESNGKRKAEEPVDGQEDPKKARVEESAAAAAA
ncbi:hypothetical protein E0Z10_g7274 [Xylaria hypoxylon]|uniref:Tetratricopeptide SHNi-TPR domain-containing protein n=1 Tax=Xylaria hypoxylon TaxID=37992 RepID=A0A4Z0YQR4_9PEZI|nr:hypothetical protein E0Z10_g7274 [Xylaria hypoxylon]